MNEHKDTNILKNNIILFIAIYFIFTLKSVIISLEIDKDYITIISSVSNGIIMILVFLGFFIFDNKQRLLIIVTSLLFIINTAIYSNPVLFGYIVLINLLMLANRIEWKKLISILLVVNVIVILLCVPLLLLADSHFIVDDRTGQRLTLGFHNPNTLSQYALTLFSIVVLWSREYVKSRSIEIVNLLLAFTVLILISYISGSRTSLLLSIILFSGYLISFVVGKNYIKRNWFVSGYFSISIIFAFAQFYYSSVYLNSEQAKIINEILSSRIWYSFLLISEMGYPAIFHATDIESYMPIDFFFVSYFYNLGWIVGIFLLYLFFKKMKKQTFTFAMCVALWGALATSLSENYYTIAIYNVGLFVIFSQRSYKGIRK